LKRGWGSGVAACFARFLNDAPIWKNDRGLSFALDVASEKIGGNVFRNRVTCFPGHASRTMDVALVRMQREIRGVAAMPIKKTVSDRFSAPGMSAFPSLGRKCDSRQPVATQFEPLLQQLRWELIIWSGCDI
jgi:hypothetical protein